MKQAIVELNRRRTLRKRCSAFKKILFLAMFIVAFLGWSQKGQTQEYPARAITMLIGNAPGAGTDVGVRMIAQEATKILGQEIIPVNKPGGGGAVSAGVLAVSKGDGYTLLAASSPALTSIPLVESVPYDPLKDFTPIIQFGSLGTAIIVRSDSPHKSFKDLIDFARKNPGKVSLGITGMGGSTHLCMMHVMQEEKVNIVLIPFGGATPTVTTLLGGHVSACAVSTSGFLSHLKAGKVKVLACTQEKRIESIPEAPTLLELGYPYAAVVDMYVIVAPKGTPSAVVKRLEEVFRKAMDTTAFKNMAENFQMYVENPLAGQRLKESIERQYNNNKEIMRKARVSK
jgi:tripartite-type tricarboxylate transporter receptor subunit TctC